jgi:DNA repair protein RadA/Sms
VGLAKTEGIAVLLAGHVTKDGDVAGPRTLEHAVDVVLTFDGEPRSGLRMLSGGKNRFGAEGEVA